MEHLGIWMAACHAQHRAYATETHCKYLHIGETFVMKLWGPRNKFLPTPCPSLESGRCRNHSHRPKLGHDSRAKRGRVWRESDNLAFGSTTMIACCVPRPLSEIHKLTLKPVRTTDLGVSLFKSKVTEFKIHDQTRELSLNVSLSLNFVKAYVKSNAVRM